MTSAGTHDRARVPLRTQPVELALRLFGEVRPDETVTALLLTASIFLLMTAYYLLKVAREPLILLGGGAEVKSYSAAGQALILILVTNAYSWLAVRVHRLALIAYVTLFFAANLVVFWALGVRGVPLAVPFFLWVGIFNLVSVTQFWSFAADTYSDEQGKRLFPIIGIGSSLGAIGGAALAGRLVRSGSPFRLMLVSAFILVASLGLIYVHHRQLRHAAGKRDPRRAPVKPGNAFALVLHDRYLLLISALVIILNIITKTGDYVFDRMLIAQAGAQAAAHGVSASVYIGEFKARFFEWINVLEVVLQSFVVSRVVKRAGVRIALLVAPVVSLGGYVAALFAPVISVVVVTRVAESTIDYSLSNTTRQTLWLLTSREDKYKAKQVVESFAWRGGDTLSAVVVWTGSHLGVGVRWFVAINVVMAALWVAIAAFLGRTYRQKATKHQASTRENGELSGQPAPA